MSRKSVWILGCSRFKSRNGCYVYGKLRRSDFLPVGEPKEHEVLERCYDSLDSDDSEGCGLEYAFGASEYARSIAITCHKLRTMAKYASTSKR